LWPRRHPSPRGEDRRRISFRSAGEDVARSARRSLDALDTELKEKRK
jgi:hypothetical protein